ncbi:MAG TPA: hypothetical protein VM030_07690 [Acidimicrobiales bacterium]|nr:hypothetical protein [Acidimicrobiales bacterium]
MTGGEAAVPTLEEVADQRGARKRDCRDCGQFDDQGDDLAYGWCKAHAQFVKLYHPAGDFWSQCQFKALGREREATATG